MPSKSFPPIPPALFGGGRVLWLGMCGVVALAGPCRGLPEYDFGNPTAEEQLYLELINRGRADPPAEGVRLASTTDPEVLSAFNYFNVNLTLLKSEFNAIPALPPLAPNASLTASARGHSAWMLANATQAHNETNPTNDPFSRMTTAGYAYATAAENIYATAKSVWFGHVGFQVDWGLGGTGGMLTGRGHRANLQSATFREIGVGVALGSHGAVGPQLVTQDFATTDSSPTFATGVAYYDLNANQFYDLGESIAGLTVNVSGSDVAYSCTTASGGGWVIPLPDSAATRTVTFSGLNTNQSVSLVVPAATNAKADLKLTYLPPVITSGASVDEDATHTLTFLPVAGATTYQWNRWTPATATAENCENLTNITSSTTGSYAVLNTRVKPQGAASFHLENTTAASQWLQLSALYYGQAAPSLSFQSSIRYATSSEKFKVQIKEEGGLQWQDVFSQTGTGSAGEATFSVRSANLTSMTGKAFRIRFLLSYGGGGYYNTSGDNVGWFIDAITFTGVAALGNNVSQTLAATAASFTPAAGTCLMAVAPVISNREFPASYQMLTVAGDVPTAPAIASQPASVTLASGSTATLSVAASGTAPTFQWYAGTTGVTTNPVAGATGSSFTTPALTATATYWVRASNAAGSADSNTATVTVINRAEITLTNLAATYNGLAKPVTATTVPAGLAVKLTYDGSATAPKNAGTYAVVATITSANYQGSASGVLVISKALAAVRLGNLSATYSGSTKSATATTTPARLAVSITYDGAAAAPKNAGTYAVVATINNANYQGVASGSLVIAKKSATARLGNLSTTYNGTAKSATATTRPTGLEVTFTYNGSTTAPVDAGRYGVVATISASNYQGKATGTLVIAKAGASVKLADLNVTYDGTAQPATATTTPPGLAVNCTYNGSISEPTDVGRYAIVATISDTNYQGKATGTLVIAKAPTPVVATASAATQSNGTNQDSATGRLPSFISWANAHESANRMAANTIASQPDADFDHDGRSNLLEYAFATSPVLANDPAPRMPVAPASASHFVLQYQRDTALSDLTFTAEACFDLTNWKAPGESGAPAGFTDVLISTSGTIETREARIPRSPGGNCYIRVRINRP